MTSGELVIDRREWPKGSDSGDVACEYIAGIGLWPEDTFGVMPSGENSHDLLFVYRDRPEYATARETFRSSIEGTKTFSLSTFGIDVEVGPGGGEMPPEFAQAMAGPAPPVPAEVSEMLSRMGIDLESYGVDVQKPGEPTPTVPVAAGTMVIHSLQWPGTLFLDHWRPAAAAFNFYRELTRLRPEDVYGYVPAEWTGGGGEGDSDRWTGFNLIYRDRPDYAPGRTDLAMRKGLYEFSGLSSHGGAPDAPLAPQRPGAIRVDEQGWPRRRLVMKLKGDRMIEYLAQEIPARGVRPEDCYGLGPDRLNEHLWLARLSDERGPLA